MQTRKSLEDLANKLDILIVRSRAYGYSMVRFAKNAMVLGFKKGLEKGYFLGLQDAVEIMAQRQLPWRTGKTNAKRILAELQWGDGANYYEVLYFHPFESLRYPGGYYDTSGENVPDSAIKKFIEF